MKIAVWDTYVPYPKDSKPENSGATMHFDILVPEGTSFENVQKFGRSYLEGRGAAEQPLTTNECRLCHIEAATPEVETSIRSRGYAIIEFDK